MLQRTHVLLSLVLGVILILSAASGLVLSGNTLVEHLRAAPSQGETVAVVAERNAEIETRVDAVGIDFAEVVVDAGGAEHGAGDAGADHRNHERGAARIGACRGKPDPPHAQTAPHLSWNPPQLCT